MRNKKKLLILFLCIYAALFSTGCDSKEQREINKANIKGAKANAVKYIKEKYGFDAAVKNAVLQRNGGVFGSVPLTTVLLEMEHCGKSFNVHIDGSYDNTDGMDNYQEDEIKASLKELAENTVSGIKEVWFCTSNNFKTLSNEISAGNMYNTYYDGANLFEMLSEYQTEVVFKYVGADVYKNNDWSVWEDIVRDNADLTIKFISYRSQAALEGGFNSVEEDYAVYVGNYCMLYNEPPTINKDTPTYVAETKNYVLYEENGIYYYIADNGNADVKIIKTEQYDISKWGSKRACRAVSPAYLVKSDKDCEIYIFYPLSDIKFSFKDSYDYNNVCSAKSFKEDGKVSYKTYNLDVIKGYSVLHHYFKGEDDFLYFMFAKNDK